MRVRLFDFLSTSLFIEIFAHAIMLLCRFEGVWASVCCSPGWDAAAGVCKSVCGDGFNYVF